MNIKHVGSDSKESSCQMHVVRTDSKESSCQMHVVITC